MQLWYGAPVGNEHFVNQDRWNAYGRHRLERLQFHPQEYLIRDFPNVGLTEEMRRAILRAIGPLAGTRILEYGCGRGELSVWLATEGAHVTGVDLGADLVAAATVLAEVNQVTCTFQQADIAALGTMASGAYDVVLGVLILHHLSNLNVFRALREAERVLRPGGLALFCEPVENSRVFNFVQNLFPVAGTRPSMLQRKAWQQYRQIEDDRDMTAAELRVLGQEIFASTRTTPFGFLIRLEGLLGSLWRQRLTELDGFLFQVCPPLKHFSQVVLVEYRKADP
jgi:2-polyprenyl-3-methyl-5-hydroxy-6-metoxy-1,4-benzoquinol methylase